MHHRTEEVLRDLHPIARDTFRRLAENLEAAHKQSNSQFVFRPFEGLRGPLRQQELLDKRPPVTHAGPWKSPHQYGLAVDFVPFDVKLARFTWEKPELEWDLLRRLARGVGLENDFDWDRAHVQHPLWTKVRALFKI